MPQLFAIDFRNIQEFLPNPYMGRDSCLDTWPSCGNISSDIRLPAGERVKYFPVAGQAG